MKIDFNIGTVADGLHSHGRIDQMRIMGRFKSKKSVVEALGGSMYYFNGYASMCLSPVGEELIRIEGEDRLLATELNGCLFEWDKEMRPVFRTFHYWVQTAPGQWQEKIYDPSQHADTSHNGLDGERP